MSPKKLQTARRLCTELQTASAAKQPPEKVVLYGDEAALLLEITGECINALQEGHDVGSHVVERAQAICKRIMQIDGLDTPDIYIRLSAAQLAPVLQLCNAYQPSDQPSAEEAEVLEILMQLDLSA